MSPVRLGWAGVAAERVSAFLTLLSNKKTDPGGSVFFVRFAFGLAEEFDGDLLVFSVERDDLAGAENAGLDGGGFRSGIATLAFLPTTLQHGGQRTQIGRAGAGGFRRLGLFLLRLFQTALGEHAFGDFQLQDVAADVGHETADRFTHLVFGDEVVDSRGLQLLQAQADAAAILVDVEHDGADDFAFLDDVARMVDALVVGHVADVDHAVDAVAEIDERTEGLDGRDRGFHDRPGLVLLHGFDEGVAEGALEAELNALVAGLHAQDNHFDLVAHFEEIGGLADLLRPGHLREMDEAVDARGEFDEGAEIGEAGHFADELLAGLELFGSDGPGIRLHLLQAEGHLAGVGVQLENFDFEFVANVDHVGGLANAMPAHVGNVQEAIDAIEIEEGAKVGDATDAPFDDIAFFEGEEAFFLLLGALFFENHAAIDDDVFLLHIDGEDADFDVLADELLKFKRIARAGAGGRHEGPAADVDANAAFDGFGHLAGYVALLFEGGEQAAPVLGLLHLEGRENGLSFFVPAGDGDFHQIADCDFGHFRRESGLRQDTVCFAFDIDKDGVIRDREHLALNGTGRSGGLGGRDGRLLLFELAKDIAKGGFGGLGSRLLDRIVDGICWIHENNTRDSTHCGTKTDSMGGMGIVWLLVFAAIAIAGPVQDPPSLTLLAALGVFQFMEPRIQAFQSERGMQVAVGIKILLCYLLIGYTGALNSSYYLILLLPVVGAATTMGAWGTVAVTTLAMLSFLSFLFFLPWEDLSRFIFDWKELFLRAVFLPVVGLSTYQLAEANRLEARKSQETAKELARANEELVKAEAAVRRSERLAALGQLTAGLAHELRNPLGTIRVSAEMLKKVSKDDGGIGREMTEYITSEVDRANSLVTRFLEFARPLPLKPAVTDVHEVIDRAVTQYERSADRPDVSVYKNYDPALRPVSLDGEWMERVFYNLLRNAAEASAAGSSITVKTRPVDGFIEIAVIDRGSGITAEHRESIFNPFFTTKASGVGLGLAIVSKIIDEHGGRILVESEPGQGSVFRVLLPA